MSTPSQVDLIVATAGLQSIGHLRDPVNLLSCVGNDPYRDESIATELQLYGLPGSDLVVLQQRAPAAIGRCAPASAAPCMCTMCVSCHAVVMCIGADAGRQPTQAVWRSICVRKASQGWAACWLKGSWLSKQQHPGKHTIALPAQAVMLGSIAAELPNLEGPDAPELLCMSSAAALALPGIPWRELQV